MLALRQQREAAPPVQVAAAPPPPPAAPRVQVASLATTALVAPPPRAPAAAPTYMQGIENPTLTPSARAALAEAARESAIERAQQADEGTPPTRAPAVVASALAAPERRAPAGSPFRSLGGIVGTAQASTLPRAPQPAPAAPAPGGNGWSVQVGAFASENLARTTANQARDVVQTMGTRTAVTPVRQGRTTLYRARVTGLTRSGAEQACARMRGRSACTVVAPGA
jgi:cell division septation protein DedD